MNESVCELGEIPVRSAWDVECELVLAKERSIEMSEGNKTRAGWLMDVLMEEVSALSGEKQPLGPVEIRDNQALVVVSAAGWLVPDSAFVEPESAEAGRRALATFASLAAAESDALIDALMDMTLEHRSLLVERIIDAGCELDARSDAAQALRFIDDGLSLEGDAASLSIRINEALLDTFNS